MTSKCWSILHCTSIMCRALSKHRLRFVKQTSQLHLDSVPKLNLKMKIIHEKFLKNKSYLTLPVTTTRKKLPCSKQQCFSVYITVGFYYWFFTVNGPMKQTILGIIKQLLDATMVHIKFTSPTKITSNSGKPLSNITCLDWINFDIRHHLVQ